MGIKENEPESENEVDEESAAILVVEDDLELAAAMCNALEDAGYRVSTIATAPKWLAQLDDDGDNDDDAIADGGEDAFVVTIVDTEMDGVGGVAGVVAARDDRHVIALVRDEDLAALDDDRLDVFAKPFDLLDLVTLVAAAVAGS